VTDTLEWRALRDELEAISARTHAFNAYVFDAWDNLWCSAHSFESVASDDLLGFVHRMLARSHVSLVRGGVLDDCVSDSRGYVYVRSYASCYVLVLRFSSRPECSLARAVVEAELDKLEALTLKLPPSDGPGTSGAESANRA